MRYYTNIQEGMYQCSWLNGNVFEVDENLLIL